VTPSTPPTPLRPREFFSYPWVGEGEWIPRPWLRWLPLPRRFRFRTFTTWLSDELWVVHDETIWEGGRVERRDGMATLVAPDRIRFTYDDMAGGTEIHLHSTGFTFSPYLMAVPVPPLPVAVLVRCIDRCTLQADGSMLDVIEMSIVGVPLGRQVMRLRREQRAHDRVQ
jgi:hypothetical protein